MTARSLGNTVQYGQVPGLPRYIVKKVNLANPLGGISSNDLFRPPALAYEDGYADGRNYGPTGKFLALHYDDVSIAQYAAGFKAGVKVFEFMNNLDNLLFQQEGECGGSES